MRALPVLRLTAIALLVAAVLPAGSPAQAGPPRCHGEPATILGTGGDDRLVGTARRDVVVAGAGDDHVRSLGGRDLVCGGPGADVLDGGAGADRLYGGTDRVGDDPGGTFLVGDVLRGGAGSDLLVGGWDERSVDARRRPDTYSWSDAGRGVVVDLSGSTGVAKGWGRDTIRIALRMGVQGSPFADTLTGTDRSDDLAGLDGGDRVNGLDGADRIFADRRGGSGRDVVRGGRGPDLIGSYAGRDELYAGPGSDFVEAYGAEPVVVRGQGGADQVAQAIPRRSGMGSVGGSGADVVSLYGDALEGGSPRPRFTVDLRRGRTSVALPRTVTGTIGGYEEYRLIGDLRWGFRGTTGPDRVWSITGGGLDARTYAGNDRVTGSPYADRVDAGRGRDVAYTGAGRDVCRGVERGSC
jgi:Ca2+-binding RTX toxin-like protein